MPLNTEQLQAAYAHRRDMEVQHAERVEAVNQYYNHWNKVTSRYANWTKPEYYEKAEAKLKKKRENIEKEKSLKERREKLRELLKKETDMYEKEILEKKKPRHRRITAETEMLERVYGNEQLRQNMKRKLEMEAKLFGRMRYGNDDENALFKSKSDNQVLAKLNWLDKKIDDQIQRDKDEAEAREQNLRLQEEINKAEQAQKECQEIREKEIQEISTLQERHMKELKERQGETEQLKKKENEMRDQLEDLEKEFILLNESAKVVCKPIEGLNAYNLKKIKVVMRARSDIYRKLLQLSIDILKRVQPVATKREDFDHLIKKYQDELGNEALILSHIDAMYESEAKICMQGCEKKWQDEHMERYEAIKNLLNTEQVNLSMKLDENLKKQNDVLDIRTAHLTSIETLNEKLKQLTEEQEQSGNAILDVRKLTPRPVVSNAVIPQTESAVNTPRSTNCSERVKSLIQGEENVPSPRLLKPTVSNNKLPEAESPVSTPRSTKSVDTVKSLLELERNASEPQITKSIENLSIAGSVDEQIKRTSPSVVSIQSAQRPKFGRKKVAWN
ncbi:trichoplein keratin filament-binding protein [Teleopsis dalmanni]|uniref:trichoplein keratin filament-binding protein n=1 Tax=Teleopsis dalmanni TaxID=139649 RepID=UPI0018CE6451|nr:trichoplein keratin filament-binding protein [Teleopsis dalmanni]